MKTVKQWTFCSYDEILKLYSGKGMAFTSADAEWWGDEMRFSQSLYRFLFPLYGKELKKCNSCEEKRDGNQGKEKRSLKKMQT